MAPTAAPSCGVPIPRKTNTMLRRPTTSLYLAPLSLLCLPLAAQVQLDHLATVDISATSNSSNPEFIGSNPAAIAWNGVDLFVAGTNNQPPGNFATVSIVRVNGALTGTPTYSPVFGSKAGTDGFRGYTALDIRSGQLVASFDAGTNDPDGIAAYDLTGTRQWGRSARGTGVGVDPGFQGVDDGIGWSTFGSGRRALQDSATGADIYTTANGMIITPGGTTFWRDFTFDPATGDFYGRKSNSVVAGDRTGGNALANVREIVPALTNRDFTPFMFVDVLRENGEVVLIYNDRTVDIPGQNVLDVIRCVLPDGTPREIDWNGWAPSTANSTSAAIHDFSFDAGTGTLAISDFTNRVVHLFGVNVPPVDRYGQGCPGSNGTSPRLTFRGDATTATGQLELTVDQIVPGAVAFFAFGGAPAQQPVGFNNCDILISPVFDFFLGPVVADGTGTASLSWTVPAIAAGSQVVSQGAVVDRASGFPFVLSNGVLLQVP